MNDPDTQAAHTSWKTLIGAAGTGLTVIGGVLGIVSFIGTYSPYNLNGPWTITNTIQSTTYTPFKNLKVGYHVFLTQKGTDITGTGEKWSENGVELPPPAHTPITITGSIHRTKVTLTFREDGTKRPTEGTFNWTYQKKPQTLSGNFTTTAADASGPSLAQRTPAPPN